MVSAIGSSAISGASGSGTGSGAAALEAQLTRYQKQLSDCVNCDSAKTPEGKAAIADLSSKISEVKARIDQSAPAKPAADISANQPAAAPSAAPDAAAGNNLNVFA